MSIIKPPTPLDSIDWRQPSVFLAGSIEMGKAENWQCRVAQNFNDARWTVLNPRRDDWDVSWEQSIENDQFREQVQWEMSALDRADHILMNFCSDTMSPITLLELGLQATSGRLVVACPMDFWRRGNVEIVCSRYGIPLFDNLKGAVDHIHPIVGHYLCREEVE